MQYFNFSRLIKKYSSEFEAITLSSGYYNDSGDWVNVETENVTMQGAIISHGDTKIYKSNGTLTAKDKRLFLLEPIKAALIGSEVVYCDNIYKIEDDKNNALFTGVYAYTLKYVSAFKEKSQSDLSDDIERLEKRLDGELVD